VRALLAGLAAVAIFTAFGCGVDKGSGGLTERVEREADRAAQARPEPRKLVMEDLEVGSGPMAGHGDQVSVLYISSDYFTGEEEIRRWGSDPPLPFRLGLSGFSPGWEMGIEGMRVGGRRRLIIPSDLTLGEGPLIYVVELVRVRKPPT
jgi:FKBP-type peptidyl-prolyl cis-trans isomerase